MKLKYDLQTDILRIRFSDKKVAESDENKNGIIIDYDDDGNILGIEILKASKQISNPKHVEYEVE